MNETCEKMLATMSLICKQLESVPWIDDFEYLCWAYLTEDLKIPNKNDTSSSKLEILEHFSFLKTSAEKVNGRVNDVTYFEMDRWLILYNNWKVRDSINN